MRTRWQVLETSFPKTNSDARDYSGRFEFMDNRGTSIKHVNVILYSDKHASRTNVTFMNEDFIKLRDTLNEIYPLDAPKAAPKTTYEVQNARGMSTVIECRTVDKLERTEIAEFRRYSDAEAFANMRNGNG